MTLSNTTTKPRFIPVETLVGKFKPDNMQDDARLSRTGGWLPNNCKGKWERTVRQQAGLVFFAFERPSDADEFRKVTASDPGMIRCI